MENSASVVSSNGFIKSFFKYLEELEAKDKQTEPKPKETEPKVKKAEPELTEEENLKLVVIEIQKLLNAAGCNAGVADGIWGKNRKSSCIIRKDSEIAIQ